MDEKNVYGPNGPARAFIVKLLGKPPMRAVRISARRAGKSRTALLGTHTAPCDAILEEFVAFKHPSYLKPEKQMPTTCEVNFLCKLLILSKLHLLSAHE